MNTLIAISITFILLFAVPNSSYATSEKKSKDEVVCVFPVKNKDNIRLKNLKDRKNIRVEIRSVNGDYVGYTKMNCKKLTIDFSKVKAGKYVVTILGDNRLQSFKYEKN